MTSTIELPPVENLDVPAAFAPAEQRAMIAELLAELKKAGWSRPMISGITEFNDSTVWRAQKGKAHTTEVARWNAFLQGVKDGTFKPTERARKANAKQMLDNARAAAALLARANDLGKAAEIKKIVAEALELLPAPSDGTDETAEVASEVEAAEAETASSDA